MKHGDFSIANSKKLPEGSPMFYTSEKRQRRYVGSMFLSDTAKVRMKCSPFLSTFAIFCPDQLLQFHHTSGGKHRLSVLSIHCYCKWISATVPRYFEWQFHWCAGNPTQTGTSRTKPAARSCIYLTTPEHTAYRGFAIAVDSSRAKARQVRKATRYVEDLPVSQDDRWPARKKMATGTHLPWGAARVI